LTLFQFISINNIVRVLSKFIGGVYLMNTVCTNGVVDTEFSVLAETEGDQMKVKFTGKVVEIGENGAFIDYVRRGYEIINTNGPVQFVNTNGMKVGDMVEFEELLPFKTDRNINMFMAEKVEQIDPSMITAIAKCDTKLEPVAVIRDLSNIEVPYHLHLRAKEIDRNLVDKAAENKPFVDMIQIYQQIGENQVPSSDITELIKYFLYDQFTSLNQVGVNYSVRGDFDKRAEEKMIEESIEKYERSGFADLAKVIRREYYSFVSIRNVFTSLYQNDILRIESVIPIKHLPDLLVTAPVWYVHGREGVEDTQRIPDPMPDGAIRFFCEAVGTKNFAWFYQMYNRRTRGLDKFDSKRDIIPLEILDLIQKAKTLFDYLVIATPYHDIASQEWANPAWMRSIDPFLFGFSKDIPFMFFLARWSGTGLFPRICEMVADTMNHLELNIEKLRKFPANSYWYMGKETHNFRKNILLGESAESVGHVLVSFANEALGAYKNGELFDFLTQK